MVDCQTGQQTQVLPVGWDAERIRNVTAFYANQSEDDELAELENAWRSESATFIQVPNELVPAVRALIAHYRSLRTG